MYMASLGILLLFCTA